MYRFRVYTGPTQAEQLARVWASLNGVVSTFAGTESVWLESTLTQAELAFALPTWARPVQMNRGGCR